MDTKRTIEANKQLDGNCLINYELTTKKPTKEQEEEEEDKNKKLINDANDNDGKKSIDKIIKKKIDYEGSVIIWRGILDWTEPIRKNFDVKNVEKKQEAGNEVGGSGGGDDKINDNKSNEIICKLLVWNIDDKIIDVKKNLPDKLTMTLMRKQFIRNTDKSFFNNATRTLFDMEACDKLNSLTKFMNSGYVSIFINIILLLEISFF